MVSRLVLGCMVAVSSASTLVSSPGDIAAIPSWDLQSTAKVKTSLSSLSRTSYDSTSWYHIGSRSTIVGGLIETGLYNTTQLWYSDNLVRSINYSEFTVPWLYRQEFALQPRSGEHFFLETNGITSKADVWLNGQEVASHLVQTGAYGGRTYDITKLVGKNNALAVQVYTTNYNKDFAQGFVDWNPYPPDNGSGIWRNVTVKQTGPVALSVPRIVTDFKAPGVKSVKVTLKTEVTNLEKTPTTGTIVGVITGTDGRPTSVSQPFKLKPLSTQTIAVNVAIKNPQVWWPKQWGDQPLYSAQLTARSNGTISDLSIPQKFGIRHVTSHVNKHNDTTFQVNGQPFQVLGGGYAPDQFLRWNSTRFEKIAQYVLDMGMNTIRLEGKEEQPELYEIADRMGLMVMPGWECCDKWEAWTYNNEIVPVYWSENDYGTANASMRHEASMLQHHPSILAFLVGSDYWPNDRAAAIYVKALQDWDWQNPIICSAAKRGYPEILGPSGMKMAGPYDWVPPNYWYGNQVGAAFGFGSELGAGVGTPEIGSLKQFLTQSDMDDLWTAPEKGLYHMSTNVSQFHNRTIYNAGLYKRYGKPTSLSDYLLKAQMTDYEATKAEYEGFSAKWNADRPATGAIYWMLNNAWPSLHWNQFDYYLHPAGSYFGTKVGARPEHVAYNYADKTIYLINHSLNQTGPRTVSIQLIDLNGKPIVSNSTLKSQTVPNTSKIIGSVSGADKIKNVAFLRLSLSDPSGKVLSRNVYWLSPKLDVLEWNKSTWWYTPVSSYADFTALQHMKPATVTTKVDAVAGGGYGITLENKSGVPAFFIRMNLVDVDGRDVVPVYWTDNYVTLFPGERLRVEVRALGGIKGMRVEVGGGNVGERSLKLG